MERIYGILDIFRDQLRWESIENKHELIQFGGKYMGVSLIVHPYMDFPISLSVLNEIKEELGEEIFVTNNGIYFKIDD